jgi:hypothetical protein
MVQGRHVLLLLSNDRSPESRFYCVPVCAGVLAPAKTICADYGDPTLVCLGFVSLAIWCLLIYIPGGNVIHAGSYGTVLLLFIYLSVSLSSVAPRLTYVLLGFQALFLFPLFAMTDAFMKSRSSMGFAGGADPGMACLAAFSLLILAMLVVFGGVADCARLTPSQADTAAVSGS